MHNPDTAPPQACPSCRGTSLEPRQRYTSAEAAAHFTPPGRYPAEYRRMEEIIRRLWGGGECRMYRCRRCRFWFPVPYVAGDAEFYANAPGGRGWENRRWEFGRAIRWIESRAGGPALRLVEIGAGAGAFLSRALRRPALRGLRPLAIELSPHAARTLRAKGVEVREGDFLDLCRSADLCGVFDLLCAFQTLEHLVGLDEVFAAFRELLRPGGLLLLSVPNGEWIDFNEERLGLWDMPPNHVGRWYPESFEAIGTRSGFRLLLCEREPLRRDRAFGTALVYRINALAADPGGAAGRINAIRLRPLRAGLKVAYGFVLAPGLLPLLPALRPTTQLAIFERER